MTQKSVIVYKPSGITMNQLILDYKNNQNNQNNQPQYINKICFAGRLDPMARGQCLFLINDECKKMNKVYHFIDVDVDECPDIYAFLKQKKW